MGAASPAAAESYGSTLAERLEALKLALPPTTRLLAVSKGHPADLVRQAAALGQRSFGESRLQEAIAKQEQLADGPDLDWHFIGRLQANKARAVLRRFGTIHSVDSLALAERLQRIAAEEGLAPGILLQVKFRADPAKTGFDPAEVRALGAELGRLEPLRCLGLMTIAPLGLTPEARLELFRECRDLADALGLPDCSMGMSGDWHEAIAAGSTWVRLGSVLFGSRPIQP
ncbi:MAG: YggS family pyridoxal phosphate-dependent enzyme [Cyanobium sp. CZS 25K]|nr:YggS family pyridoxal phosphate-dependent enzyme [Cyanobium sp. CZS25K]